MIPIRYMLIFVEQYEEMKSLSEIQRDRETRDPLNLMLDHFLELAVVDNCYHISCLAVDQIWVSDRTNIILTKITGQILHHLTDSCRDGYATGLHTVNSDSDIVTTLKSCQTTTKRPSHL